MPSHSTELTCPGKAGDTPPAIWLRAPCPQYLCTTGMKATLLLISFSLWTAIANADVVYVLPPEEIGVSVQVLDLQSFIEEANGFAKAGSLKASRPSGDFELRVWRLDVMVDGGIGYVLSDGQLRTYEIMRRGSRYTARILSTRKHALSKALITAANDVALLTGNQYSCGIMDGESVLIDASIEGKTYHLWAGNPESCTDKYSKRIAKLLRSLDGEAQQSDP